MFDSPFGRRPSQVPAMPASIPARAPMQAPAGMPEQAQAHWPSPQAMGSPPSMPPMGQPPQSQWQGNINPGGQQMPGRFDQMPGFMRGLFGMGR